MPSNMKLEELVDNKIGLKSTERRQNRSLTDRQKRPDIQIYVPRALRGTQRKSLPVERSLESKSEKKSIDKNNQKTLDEHLVSLENKIDDEAYCSQHKNIPEKVEDSNHIIIPQAEATDDSIFIKNEIFDTTSLLSDKQIASCQMSESLNPCVSGEQVKSFNNSLSDEKNYSEISESLNCCLLDEKMDLPNISKSLNPSLSDQQMDSSEINESLNPCLSDEQVSSSDIVQSVNTCLKPDDKIASTELSVSLNTSLSDKNLLSPEINENQGCASKLGINLLDNTSSKTNEISSPLTMKESNTTLINDQNESECQEISSNEISSSPISSKDVLLDSRNNSSEVLECQALLSNEISNGPISSKDVLLDSRNNSSEVSECQELLSNEISSSPISSKDVLLDLRNNSSEVSTNIDACESSGDNSNESLNREKEDSWESKFDDDGECLNPEFLKDLKNITGQIEVLVVKNKYKGFVRESSNDGYDCIIELHGFPMEFNTQDLVSAFSQFHQANYTIKWVDDCHALAIFSSPSLANQALLMNHPFVKTRPISEGIKESQEKAKWCTRHSEPVKPRPTTSAVLARRLVSGALGLKVQASKEQRDQERNMLKEAKEKRKLKAKQKQAIWDGVVL